MISIKKSTGGQWRDTDSFETAFANDTEMSLFLIGLLGIWIASFSCANTNKLETVKKKRGTVIVGCSGANKRDWL
jgi:hypothetical protein